ncbi:AIPR protein [Pseudidiomarina planktonica]|uniref:AIPR protein n=1 Tax=Pseudidiomarina planktonica TaxID=1323738 RepID=A0A1Y6FZN0_9GAMM|nr:AIPR family protein [Pseudidiomarina planktonica]RUO63248.1 abortive phage resistance protein [Pseudidiomarina planktonica]SMQ80537.1 AIPR protein [Pseudidiomarina planktonica]
MASLNDFKILKTKCLKYFENLQNTKPLKSTPKNDIEKERLGFYIFALENLCNLREITDIVDCITDSEFLQYETGKKYDDFGIDAIYLDEDEAEIKLFNFKYREKFNLDKRQSSNDAVISTKFINALYNESTASMSGRIKRLTQGLISALNENRTWKITLYLVSNENKVVLPTDPAISQLKDHYDLEVQAVGLDEVSQVISIRPEPIDATIMLDAEALMVYRESNLSTFNSFIARIPSSEIVRLTCTDESLRHDYNIEDLSVLSEAKLDYSVLFDNVRGFVVKSKYNKNIIESLRNDPQKFFMYNNGLTVVAHRVESQHTNAKKKVKLKISGFQVLNGGQTLRSIHKFNKDSKSNIDDYLSSSEVLVRIFSSDNDQETVNRIAEYTNSQNKISNVDLKSLSTEQLHLEQYLEDFDIIYSRKSGDTGITEKKSYRHKISMERFGQILFALSGSPHQASNQKQQIFGRYYDQLFGTAVFNIESAPRIIEEYFSIVKYYETLSNTYTPIEQKYYYILYLGTILPKLTIDEKITILEDCLKAYETKTELSDARKMIQVAFFNFVKERAV